MNRHQRMALFSHLNIGVSGFTENDNARVTKFAAVIYHAQMETALEPPQQDVVRAEGIIRAFAWWLVDLRIGGQHGALDQLVKSACGRVAKVTESVDIIARRDVESRGPASWRF
jgi:hypothetical protein